MAEIDTSIYKPQTPVDPFAVIRGLQGIEQQKLAIDQSKLKLINDRTSIMNNMLGSLISDPALSWDKVAATGQHMVRMGFITPEMWTQQLTQFAGSTGDPQKLKGMLTTLLSRNLETQQQVNWHYSQPVQNNTGDSIVTRAIGQNPNVPVRGIGAPLPTGIDPSTLNAPVQIQNPGGNIDNSTMGGYNMRLPKGYRPQQRTPDGQFVPPPGAAPNALGGSGAVAPPVAAPPPMGGMPAPAAPSGGVPAPAPVTTAPLPPIPARPAGPAAAADGYSFPGPDPGRIEAEKSAGLASAAQQAENRKRAAAYQETIYPLERSLKGLKDLGTTETGPGAEARHQVVNFLVTNGFMPADTNRAKAAKEFDITRKSLVQYINQNGDNGTNDKLASAISGNANTTMSNAAALDVVKARIAFHKMEQAAHAKADTYPSKDYSPGYNEIKNALDPRAFAASMMTPAERKAMIDKMKPDEKKKYLDSVRTGLNTKFISRDIFETPPAAP